MLLPLAMRHNATAFGDDSQLRSINGGEGCEVVQAQLLYDYYVYYCVLLCVF